MTTVSSNNMNVEGPKDPVGGPSVTVPSSSTPAKALPSSASEVKTPVASQNKNSTLEKLANIKATAALGGSTKVLRQPVSARPQKAEADPKAVNLKTPRMLTSHADPKPVDLKTPRMLTSTAPKLVSGKDLEEIGAKMEYSDVEESSMQELQNFAEAMPYADVDEAADSMKELSSFADSMPYADVEEEVEADPKAVELKNPRMLSSNIDPKPVDLKNPRMLTSNIDPKPVDLKPPRMLTSNEPKNVSSKELEEIGAKMEYSDVEESSDSMQKLQDFAESMPYADVEEEVEADPKAVELKNPRMLSSNIDPKPADLKNPRMLTTKESTSKDPAWDDADKLRPLPPNPMGRSSDATINKMYESVQRQLDVLNNLKDISKQVEAKLNIKIDLPAKRSQAELGKLGAWTVENFDAFVYTLKADLSNNQLKDYAEILNYMNTL